MIVTQRLEIVPATAELIYAALDGPRSLANALGAAVPLTWPPLYLDQAAFEFTLERLAEGPEQAGWWLHFVLLRAGGEGRTLIGAAGFKGPPSHDGVVEVGYAIVSDHRRKGYASEALRGLLAHLYSLPSVERVISETLPQLSPSIGVLNKCGFRQAGEGSEPGILRFELTRAEYAALGSTA